LPHWTRRRNEKSFLRGLGDIMDAMEDPKSAPKWAMNFLTSYAPSTMRRAATSADDMVRETRIWGKGEQFTDRLADAAAAKFIPGMQETMQPKVNVWGEDITKDEGKHATTDWLYRLLSPVDTRDMTERNPDAMQLNRLLLNWNNANPDNTWWPDVPDTFYRRGGETYYWTPEEYYELSKRAGDFALRILGGHKDLNPENPTEGNIRLMKEVLKDAREYARETLLAERAKK
jgi:hypothetical protein